MELKFYLDDGYETTEIEQPKDFINIKNSLSRDFEYHGVFFQYTEDKVKLGFCCDAKTILEDAFNTYSIDAKVYFIVDYREGSTGSFTEVFRGRIDFTTRNVIDDYFHCSVNQIDELIKIKNRSNINISVLATETLDGGISDPLVPVYTGLHSKTIITTSLHERDNTDFVCYRADGMGDFYILLGFTNKAKDEIQETFIYDLAWTSLFDLDLFNFRASERNTINLSLEGDFKFELYFDSDLTSHNYTVGLYYRIKRKDGTFDSEVAIDSHSASFSNYFVYTLSVSEIDTNIGFFDEGDSLFIYPKMTLSGISFMYTRCITINDGAYLKLESYSNIHGSNGPGYQIHNVANKLLEVITGNSNPLQSEILGQYSQGYAADGCLSELYLLNGYAVRSFDYAQRPLTWTWKKLIDSLKVFGLGYSIAKDGKVIVEPYTNFYSGDEILDLGEVDDFEKDTFNDILFNSLSFGFNKYAEDEEDSNNLDDFHTVAQWLTPILSTINAKEYKMVTDFIMSAFLIEYTRRQQATKDLNKSTKYDDNIFAIQTVENSVTDDISFYSYDNSILMNAEGYEKVASLGASFRITDSTNWDGVYTFDPETTERSVLFGYTVYYVFVNENITMSGSALNVIISSDDIPIRAERNEAMNVTTGLIDESTHYNLRYTPKRFLLAWDQFINSGLFTKSDSEVLKNTFYKNKSDLVTEITTGACSFAEDSKQVQTENENILLSDLRDAIFKPNLFKFKVCVSQDNIEAIKDAHLNASDTESHNFGYLSWSYRGGDYSGFLLSMKYNPVDKICEFEMIEKA